MKFGPFWIGLAPPPKEVNLTLSGVASMTTLYYSKSRQVYRLTMEEALADEKGYAWKENWEVGSVYVLKVGDHYFSASNMWQVFVEGATHD